MKVKKKFMLLLVAILCITWAMPLHASVSLPSISSGRPVKCYTLKSSGRIYAYTAANLRNRTGGYIDCASDECSILRISGNAVQVKYPVGRGTRTAWFARNEFSSCNLANGAAEQWTQNSRVTTYRRANGRSSYGSISAGDTCYKLSESRNYMQVIYPVSGGYKMGWVQKSNLSKTSSELLFPLKGNIRVTGSSAETGGYKCDYKASAGTAVYAPADGRVVFRQTYAVSQRKLASYGNNIIFTSGDGHYEVKCAHLSEFNGVSLTYTSSLTYPCSASNYSCRTKVIRTKNVKKGDLLGYTGKTGNASGPHLHLEVKKDGRSADPTAVFQTWQ